MPKFSNLVDVIRHFSDEQVCRDHFAQLRWVDGKAVCPYCGHEKCYNIEGGKRFKCAHKECRKKFSVTVGTIFESSKIPLSKWLVALWLVANHKKGISAIQLGKDIGVSEKSARFVVHRINAMLKEKAPKFIAEEIDEEGNAIAVPKEVDEKYYGPRTYWQHKSKKKKGTQGRSLVNKTPILGILDRSGLVYTEVVPNTKRETIVPIIQRVVEPGATIYTDEHLPYRTLKKDYNHDHVNHRKGEFVKGEVHSQTIECFWSQLRGIKSVQHSVSPKHLYRYVAAYEYRWNNRKLKGHESVDLAIVQSVGKRLKYKELIAK